MDESWPRHAVARLALEIQLRAAARLPYAVAAGDAPAARARTRRPPRPPLARTPRPPQARTRHPRHTRTRRPPPSPRVAPFRGTRARLVLHACTRACLVLHACTRACLVLHAGTESDAALLWPLIGLTVCVMAGLICCGALVLVVSSQVGGGGGGGGGAGSGGAVGGAVSATTDGQGRTSEGQERRHSAKRATAAAAAAASSEPVDCMELLCSPCCRRCGSSCLLLAMWACCCPVLAARCAWGCLPSLEWKPALGAWRTGSRLPQTRAPSGVGILLPRMHARTSPSARVRGCPFGCECCDETRRVL